MNNNFYINALIIDQTIADQLKQTIAPNYLKLMKSHFQLCLFSTVPQFDPLINFIGHPVHR